MAPSDFNEIRAEHPSPLPPTYALSKEIEGITREIAVLIGYLLKGMFVSFGRKVRHEGIPRAMQFSYWLRKQSVILARKLIEVGTPKVIEAGRITKGLLIIAAENLKTKGVPLTIGTFQVDKGLIQSIL